MSESQGEDVKRRERARRVDALTGAARQPGEGSRLGTRIAGSVAVLALAAGATMGVGAWHSYRTQTAAEEAALAKEAKDREQAAATRKLHDSPSPGPSESKKKREEKPPSDQVQEKPAPREEEKPQKTVKKPSAKVHEKAKQQGSGLSRILLANGATKKCANLPGYDGHPEGGPVNQYPCNPGDDDNQLWNITTAHPQDGRNESGLVLLSNQKDDLCLDLPDTEGKPAGTHVVESTCNGNMSDNQQWRIDNLPGGGKKIHNFASNDQCLQVPADSGKTSVQLVIGSCDASSSSWYFRQ